MSNNLRCKPGRRASFRYGCRIPLLLVCFGCGYSGAARAALVTFYYEAEIVTISNTPFGLSSPTDIGAIVTGSFTYNDLTPDENPGNTTRGDYPHDPLEGGLGGGGFVANIAANSIPAFTITGSDIPLVNIEDFDAFGSETFRFRDGPDTFNPGGTMFLNGVPDTDIRLELAITGDLTPAYFPNDSLPSIFPIEMPPIIPHTFALRDLGGPLGTVALLQFTSITIPEPSSLALGGVGLFAFATMAWRRRRTRNSRRESSQ